MSPSPVRTRPYVPPGSKQHSYLLALWQGEDAIAARDRLGVTDENARQILFRLRQSASQYLGRELNEYAALRLLFDCDRAEQELRECACAAVQTGQAEHTAKIV